MTNSDEPQKEWKGYTFEELQMRRVSVLARTAVTRQLIEKNYSNISAKSMLVPRKLDGAINYLKYIEYAAVAWRTYTRVRAIVRLLRRKK